MVHGCFMFWLWRYYLSCLVHVMPVNDLHRKTCFQNFLCVVPVQSLDSQNQEEAVLMFLLKFGDFLVSNSVWFLSPISFLQLTIALVNAIGIMYSSWVDFWGTIFAYYNNQVTKISRVVWFVVVQLRTVVNSQYSGSSLTSQFKLAEEATWLNWRWDVIDFPTRAET